MPMSHPVTDLPALLRAQGNRLTPQRQILLDTLCEMGGHVTVAALYERVHERYPAIDKSTVYRALDFFVELGLVNTADLGGAAVYEIASGEHSGAHHHLVCQTCGHIDHVPADAFDDFAARLLEEFDFVADMESVTIHGVCRGCYADAAAEASDENIAEPQRRKGAGG